LSILHAYTYQVNLEVTMNNIIETMIEIIIEKVLQYFNQLRKDDSIYEHNNFSLGSPIPDISLEDNFDYTVSPKIDISIEYTCD